MKKEEQKFISLAEAAKMTNYSQDYISLLCRQGKLKAEKLGRNWVTTKEWVYNYIDNTQGKGTTIVPVKVKAAQDASEPEKRVEKNISEKGKNSKINSQRMILECAVFCFAFLFLIVGAWGFMKFQGEIDASADQVSSNVYTQNAIMTANELKDKQETSAANAVQQCPTCIQQFSLPSTLPFDKETDPAVIDNVTKQIEANFSGKVDIQIYKKFAVVSSKSKPADKFLYVFGE